MKMKSASISIIILVFIFGGIFISSMLGMWITTSSKVPAKIEEGEFAGQNDPADIRGSYTFGDISKSFDVPVEVLGEAFGVPDPARYESFQCKELETIYEDLKEEGMEIGTSSVRLFVVLYTGIPIELEEESYLLDSGVKILKDEAKLNDEQIEYLDSHTVILEKEDKEDGNVNENEDIDNNNVNETKNNVDEQKEEQKPPTTQTKEEAEEETEEHKDSTSDNVIRGRTIFQDLINWGVKMEDIEKAVGTEVTDRNAVIRDYLSSKGIEFGTVKETLQELVDSAK